MTTCVLELSSVPIIGSARMPSQSLTTGVDNSSISCCWRKMTSSRACWWTSVVQRPRRSSRADEFQSSSTSRPGSFARRARSRRNRGCLNEKTNVAVSVGVNPCCPRFRDSFSSISRRPDHSGRWMSSRYPSWMASRRRPRKSRQVSRRSVPRSIPVDLRSATHSSSKSASWSARISGSLLEPCSLMRWTTFRGRTGDDRSATTGSRPKIGGSKPATGLHGSDNYRVTPLPWQGTAKGGIRWPARPHPNRVRARGSTAGGSGCSR